MNILFFSRALPCHGTGGMERMAWDVAAGMAERGHTVRIVTTANPEGSLPDTAAPTNIAVEYLERTRPGHYSSQWWQATRTAFLRANNDFKPDVVFSVSAGAKAVLPLINGIPAVMQAHGTLLQEMRSKVSSGDMLSSVSAVHNLTMIPQDLLMYRRVRKVIAIGPTVYNSLLHPLYRLALPAKKVVMIPNGIDTLLFKADPAAGAAIRKKLGISEHANVLVTASRLHRQKGIHFALEAFAQLNRDDVWYLIIGDGQERDNLTALSKKLGIANRVVFTGQVAHKELPGYLLSGDAFVFTTTWREGLPLNLLEAMAMNLPCVISKRLLETIDSIQGVKGIHPVEPTDASNISRKMSIALLDKSQGRRAFIERHFSRAIMLDKYEQTLMELTEK